MKAELSKILDDDEAKHGPELANDLDFATASYSVPASDGTVWLKLTLDQAHCVHQVIWYFSSGTPLNTWTCNQDDCSNCDGDYCDRFTLTVSTEGAVSDLSSVLNCKYGDTVKLEKMSDGGFSVWEIAVIGKQGKLNKQRLSTASFRHNLSNFRITNQ